MIVAQKVFAAKKYFQRNPLDVPSRLWWALLGMFLYHGSLLFFGSFESTYDAYVHIFMGDHYRRDWFSTWDQRWYTGFTTVSYPPGTHMALAAVSKVVGDLKLAFAIVQITMLSLLTVGVYRFSRLWVHKEAAGNAALLLVVSSSIAETIHLFGQLPTIWALAFLLNATPYFKRWAFDGSKQSLFLGLILLAACTAGHHVTTLFGSVFFLGPIIAQGLLEQSRASDNEPSYRLFQLRFALPRIARRVRRVLPSLLRVMFLGIAILTTLITVVLPYWWWSTTDPIKQIPIPHGSRANFLADHNLGLIFFAIPWGVLLLVLPYAFIKAITNRIWPLAASLFLLFLLGTGGTTPIPKMLLGPAFDILTLDRFTFWGTILILPLAGLFVCSLQKSSLHKWLITTGGRPLATITQTVFVLLLVAVSVFSTTIGQYKNFQPQAIDTDPIVSFINKDQHERWRYLTLGFGDQVAWLSAQTTATQVDGNYHSARRLPELTSTSVERLEGAKYRGISGLGSLQQFLEVPEKYNLKFVFSNDRFYDPVLHFNGWQRIQQLENGIMVWERADIPPLPAQLPVREVPKWQRLLWGVLPPGVSVTAFVCLIWIFLGKPRFKRLSKTQNTDQKKLRWYSRINPYRWINKKLLSAEQKLPTTGESYEKTKTPRIQRLLENVQKKLFRKLSIRQRIIRLSIFCAIAFFIPTKFVLAQTQTETPVIVLANYYEDLDFRRWEDAYDALHEKDRPNFELWRLQRSVNGGILASFAKLDDITVVEHLETDTEATVTITLTYLTAVDWYEVERTHKLTKVADSWQIQPDKPDVEIPPDQLLREQAITYGIQGRRRVTSKTTELIDVQDRPELYIKNATLLSVDEQPVMVGEVVNLDIDPADITLTGVLRNKDEDIIGQYNATEEILHTLLPRESTPFLLRFEEVAAGQNIDFDPLSFEPLQLDEEITNAEIYAKAVVTEKGLYRGLDINSVQVDETENGLSLTGELRNHGAQEAVIPRVLVSFLDEAGTVMWVHNHYVEYAIRAHRERLFTVTLPDISDHENSTIPFEKYHNGIPPQEDGFGTNPTLLDAPAGLPYSQIRVDVSTFVEED